MLVCLVPNKIQTGIPTTTGQVRRWRYRELKERAAGHAAGEGRVRGRPGSSLPSAAIVGAATGILAQGLLGYFLLPRIQCEQRQAAVWGNHSCPNSPSDSQGRLEPSARRPRFPDAARRGVTEAPPPAGAAHLKAWPRRWACARRWAWRGSFCPFPSPPLAAETSPENGPRRGGRPRARSLIHCSAARGLGPKGPARRAGSAGAA